MCLLLLLCVAVAGCHKPSTKSAGPVELRIGLGTAASSRDSALEGIGALLFSESLLVRQTDGRTVPGLATSWQWQDGGRTLRLQLKEDVRFHDGSLLTSEHVVQLLKQNIDSDGQELGFASVTGVSAAGLRTVVVTLSQPDFFLLPELTGLKIVRPDAPDIATGPFKIVSRSPVFEAVRFDNYHGGTPAIERVRVSTFASQRAAWTALLRGEVDALQEVSREIIEFASRASSVRTYRSLQSFYIPLVLNQQHPLLGKIEVRRALNEAIDRDAIVASGMGGHAQVAQDPIWPLHWAYSPPTEPQRPDQANAERRMDAVGLKRGSDRSGGGMAPRFTVRCLFLTNDPMYERIALMLQRQLFAVGVNLVLEPADLQNLQVRANAGDFDTLLARANAGRSLDFTYRFWHSADSQASVMWRTGYRGVDGLLDQLRASTTDDEARTVVGELRHRFRNDVPAIFLAWPQITRAINSRFDVGTSNEHDPFAKIWEWRPTETRHR
ncbi:MAG: ABC transporter substrate-binding protein [Vicinamibacterales bacterium]